MSLVYLDMIDGNSATANATAGYAVTRRAIVDLVYATGQGPIIQAALDAVINVVGDVGSTCPGISYNNYLEAFSPKVLASGDTLSTVEVLIVYKGFPTVQVEIGTCLQTRETNIDALGNPIYLMYQYPAGYSYNTQVGGKVVAQGGTVQQVVQDTTLVFKFTMVGGGGNTASTNVMNLANSTVGVVNTTAWGSAPSSMNGPRTWLGESVRGMSNDGGLTYAVTATFHYRSETWDQLLTFVDPFTGKVPGDIYDSSNNAIFYGPYSDTTSPLNGKYAPAVSLFYVYKQGTLPVMPPAGLTYPPKFHS
jgi:hypothetical protein